MLTPVEAAGVEEKTELTPEEKTELTPVEAARVEVGTEAKL